MTASIPPRGDLRRRVLAGEPTVGAFVQLADPIAAEVLARSGFDWLIVDLEHGHGTLADLLPSLLAIATTPTAALVRVESVERLRIGRALDLGADGLMLPRVETPEEAAEALTWLRYPPAGIRGVALSTRGAGYGAIDHPDVHRVNDDVLGIVQIESPRAVEHADAIAALDGVDVLFVGPADLSHAMGIPGEITDATFLAHLDTVAAAARRHGKAAGILLRDTSTLRETLDRGFSFVGVGSDVGSLAGSVRRLATDGRAILGG